MTERVKGEQQELHQAVGRVIRIRYQNTGTPTRPAQQLGVTIPKAIAEVMFARTELWRWELTDDGVLLRPIDSDADLPRWARNGAEA